MVKPTDNVVSGVVDIAESDLPEAFREALRRGDRVRICRNGERVAQVQLLTEQTPALGEVLADFEKQRDQMLARMKARGVRTPTTDEIARWTAEGRDGVDDDLP